MTENARFCQFCGAPLASGANFCESCGQPVIKAPPAAAAAQPEPEPVTPPPASAQPFDLPSAGSRPEPEPFYPDLKPNAYEPPQPAKRKTALPIILGAVGCLGLLCIAAVVVAVIFFVNTGNKVQETFSEEIPLQVPIGTAIGELELPGEMEATVEALLPTVEALPDLPGGTIPELAPNAGDWSADVGQQRTDSYFADNFSSDRYDWADVQDDIRVWGVQDGHYVLHLFEPDYVIWAYLPIDFVPAGVGFDAQVQPGFDEGGYGVICHYQDENNYHYVSVDPQNSEYSIGRVRNDEYEMLMEDWWMPAIYLNSATHAVNTIRVLCDPQQISLYINGQLEAKVAIDPATPGRTAIFGETWEDMPPDGFKVFIDNLYAFEEE